MNWNFIALMTLAGIIAGYYQSKILDILTAESEQSLDLPSVPKIMMVFGVITMVFTLLGDLITPKVGLHASYLVAISNGSLNHFDHVFFQSLGEVLLGLILVSIPFFLIYYQVCLPLTDKNKAIKIEKLGSSMGLSPRIFSGGIFEEIIFRFAQLSLIMWICLFFLPFNVSFWTANVISSLFFGLAHLPGAKNLGIEPDRVIVTSTLALNGIIGLLFGYLFLQYGLIFAMIAHSGLHVIWVLIFKLNLTKVHNMVLDEIKPVEV